MRVGEMIMGSDAQLSTVREVQVYRDGTLVTSGSAYIPGEELLVALVGPDDTGVQFVFEATNAVFIGGGCDGHRVANTKTAKLLLPSDTSPDAPSVQIIAGWATGYTTVHITPTFALTPSRGDPLSGSTPLELHAESSKDTLNAGVEDADAKVTPDSPNAGLRPEMELAGGEGTLPAKTHLRKQPQGLDLPQTLPADHKIKMKPKSPNAFARAHPKLTEKNPKLTVEDGVDNKVDRFTENSAGNKGNIVTRAAAAETALKVPELSAEPAGIAPAVISDTVAPHKEDTRPADEREDTNIENVMESMDKFTEQVQQRAQQKKTTVPKAPLKSPSKRTKFMDSWHSKPRKEKNPVKLEVGDVQRVPSAENDAEQLKQAAELKVAQGEQAQADAELPGADLSATEKRMRRSRGKKICFVVCRMLYVVCSLQCA